MDTSKSLPTQSVHTPDTQIRVPSGLRIPHGTELWWEETFLNAFASRRIEDLQHFCLQRAGTVLSEERAHDLFTRGQPTYDRWLQAIDLWHECTWIVFEELKSRGQVDKTWPKSATAPDVPAYDLDQAYVIHYEGETGTLAVMTPEAYPQLAQLKREANAIRRELYEFICSHVIPLDLRNDIARPKPK